MSSTATFTIEEYEHMIKSGAFTGPAAKHLELIRGELRMMSPQGAEHSELISQLIAWSHQAGDPQRCKIRIQSSIEIPQIDTQPEPDVVWADPKSYARRRPQPHEVLLLIEVADSSLAFDLGEKCQLYCEAGIRDYWVVDIPARTVHVHRDPRSSGYHTHDRFTAGDNVTALLLDQATLSVADLFACLEK